MSADDLVLITGASGHLGFKVLVLALQAGYKARVAVRSQDKANAILATESIRKLNPGTNLEFVVVVDILASDAYTSAVQGVKYIIHCASPITSGITEDFDKKIIQPALKGTTNILEAAYKSSGISRIVITSSIVAVIPFKEIFSQSGTTFDGSMKVPYNSGPYKTEFEAYAESKVRALAFTHQFVAEKKPGFDIINIMPSYIIGKNELVTSVDDFDKGTNKALFGQIRGYKRPAFPGTTVYLNDVAAVHVKALDPQIPGNQDFVATSGGIDGIVHKDAIDIVKNNFPDAISQGILPLNGVQPTLTLKIDASRTEKVFGLKFSGLETQVKSITQHYLDLVAAQ
ncbi:hypothetical protein V1509DRAFT_586727 [Lipomyces kononenkoae]